MTNYTIRLVTDNNKWADFKGFVPEVALGKFDGGYGINTMAHDLFEHWFEDTRYFRTRELSQAGECVALGIRQYLYENSNIVDRFMGFNRYQGVEWNSWNTICGQVNSVEDGDDTFLNDFNYKCLSTWDGKNRFEGGVSSYYKRTTGYDKDIEKAFSYGYWLGGHVFDDLSLVYDFLEKLSKFLRATHLEDTEMYEEYFPDFKMGFTMKKKSKLIIGRFDNGVVISTNSKVEPAIEKWLKYYDYDGTLDR